MLMFCPSKDDNNSCAKLLGLTGKQESDGGLISQVTSLLAPISCEDGGLDTCSFYSGPSDATIFAFGESNESCGSIAYDAGGESCGSIAYDAGGESCGSIASSCGGFSGGGCSYSC